MRVSTFLIASALAVAAAFGAAAQSMSVPWASSAWSKGYNSGARLTAGVRDAAGKRSLLAGVELRLADGWKTYWRQPGDAGGVAPQFDWAASQNVAAARVLYPVPERLVDANGQSIGYKKHVVFPVEITPRDPAKPVVLRLGLEYGICREICVPAETRLELPVPADLAGLPPDTAAALARVPVATSPGQPALKSAAATLKGSAPSITFDIAGPAEDLFVDAGDTYLPVAAKVAGSPAGAQRWRIDLKNLDDIEKLAGRTLTLTIATAAGGVETTWVVK